MVDFSIIMPTYNQSSFIRRAILSLCNQIYKNWELIIVNDGSSDFTEDYISDYLASSLPIRYIKNETNKGLGAAINQGLSIANYEHIAYLPSDDFYDEDHLSFLKKKFDKSEDIILVFSGFRHNIGGSNTQVHYDNIIGTKPGFCLQLVQTAHKKTDDRWIERSEYVSDDLFYTFWRKLTDKGVFAPTKEITCEWTNHPDQRHKITGEKYFGGLNRYRHFYRVRNPIRIRTTNYKIIDENAMYTPYRRRITSAKNSLKIVLVGDLAYNPERIYALEEAGHKLYGLWAKPAFCYATIGPLPFGHVQDIAYENWREQMKEIKPDIIYAQISTGAIEIAYEVMKAKTGVPMVWHFKESPHEAMRTGQWSKLIELYTYAEGRIYLNEEDKKWVEQFIPPIPDSMTYLLDPELPKNNCFTDDFSEKLSIADGAIHTVVVGRMIGISVVEMKTLADNNVHIHVYNENYVPTNEVITPYVMVAPKHFHIHNHHSQLAWVREFSKYDAGWLHCIDSSNNNNLMRIGWPDLNLPARINTLAAAGLPIIQKDNSDHVVAMQNYVKRFDVGVFYKTIDDLILQLKDRKNRDRLTRNMLTHRSQFTFDYHVPNLIEFFRSIIKENKKNPL